MNLKTQIVCLIFSFFFGIFLFFIYRMHYYSFFIKKGRGKYFFQFMITFLSSFLYFFILNYINDGILHYYFLLVIAFGFLLSYHFMKK